MQIHLISIGNRMPGWVENGYQEYAKRLPRECELILKEIAPGSRVKNTDLVRTVRAEGERILAAIPPHAYIVALDVNGKSWSTPELTSILKGWLESGRNVALLVGGPEGLSESAKSRANEFWSLSKLTFPHPLVRILVAEQIYRAWSILQHHPYHR